MANFFVDPSQVAIPESAITRSRILDRLPALQRNKRRAASLREQQLAFRKQAQMERELGGYAGQATRGLTGTSRAAFDPVQRWIPNYAGQMEKLIGGIGDLYQGNKADAAEDEYNAARNTEIMDTLGQYGDEDRPESYSTDRELRGYLGLMGEDVKDFGFSGDRKVRSTQKLGNGNLGLVYDDGIEDTGMEYDYGIKAMSDAQGNMQGIGTSGAGRGKFAPITPMGGQQAPAPGATPTPAPGTGPGTTTVPGNAGAGTATIGIEGLTPPQAQQLQQMEAMWHATGMPDEFIGEQIQRFTDAAAKENMAAAQEQGAAPAPAPAAPAPAAPAPAAPAPAAPAPAPGGAMRVLTPGEEAAQKKQAEVDVTNANALPSAQTKGLEKAAEFDEERVNKAKTALSESTVTYEQLEKDATALLAHPGLPGILKSDTGEYEAGRWRAHVPDSKAATGFLDMVLPGSPENDALKRHNQVKGEVFLAAYKTLKGGGQITEIEGTKAEQAMARMDRASTETAYRQAVQDFVDAYKAGLEKLRQVASGADRTIPSIAPSAAPSDEDLYNKYK